LKYCEIIVLKIVGDTQNREYKYDTGYNICLKCCDMF